MEPMTTENSKYSTIQAAVDAIRRGEVVIVVDAEDRENEGDFICAAELVTAETINFMLRGRGQLCAPILPSTCQRLELRPLVDNNTAPLQTAFMTPVDHAGSKTGITAGERAETIRRLASDTSQPKDFVRPGHVYPLLAMEGGVLRRAGHTEAAVDLARMAGLAPAGVLTEILDDSGDRATRDDLMALAEKYKLEIISIEQLIAHRRVNEKIVSRVSSARLPTKYGEFRIAVYSVQFESQEPIAIYMATLQRAATSLRRWCGCIAVFYGRPAAIAALRLWRSTSYGFGDDRCRRAWSPGLSPSRRSRHRLSAKNSRVCLARRRARHGRSQPQARFQG